MPPGSAVVFRAFGSPEAEARGRRLRQITRHLGLKLLIGADAGLAARLGADGVHLPERLARQARAVRARHPRWLVTTAAHSPAAAHRGLTWGADAVVISAIFPSRSNSAGPPMGPVRLAALVRGLPGPAYALGGVNDITARRLADVGLVGLAAVEAFRT